MTLDDMVRRHGSWLEAGVEEGPVVSSRIRLARNLDQYSFPGWASEEENLAVWNQAVAMFQTLEPNFISWSMAETPALDKEILFERHLISQELAEQEDSCGVFVSPDECMSVMVNEEDHIRIQSLQAGLNLQEAWRAADKLDDALEAQLTYAFSPKLGYLTSCPSNVGTGMRASVMLHLPGLVLMEEMDPVINGISKIGLAVRGMWGEGTEAAGNMFQVSNQITLGRREDEIIAHLEQIVLELIEHENNARIRLMENRSLMVEDHVARAFGTLSHARLLSSGEALNLLSTLRLGRDLGMTDQFSRRELDTLFISSQPAHLQKLENKELEPEERDVVRAEMLRDYMKNASASDI
ncbi:protein arginine kinase [Pontiella sulfatireligans]|uniref:Protein-arginine kinase n=1 Tax=Pontiella sulfatireligans TaxID=2750658 RepID=A0A6C2UGC0_9BACT|nr:protein arginine kinase [Pontiella sulfatireligans]VGO18461.1 Protein-arginine kinase [Pontiella sulfatireligans]